MTTMIKTHTTRRPTWARVVLGMVLGLVLTPVAQAENSWSSYSGDFSGVSYNQPYSGYNSGYHGGGHGGHKPSPAPQTSNNSGRRYYYNVGYRGTGSGFGFMNYNSSRNSNNGYQGAGGGNNTPHRGDWYAKLQAQRRWDEQEFKKAQQGRGGAECGLSGAPAYCYKLQGPYPTEMKIVRY